MQVSGRRERLRQLIPFRLRNPWHHPSLEEVENVKRSVEAQHEFAGRFVGRLASRELAEATQGSTLIRFDIGLNEPKTHMLYRTEAGAFMYATVDHHVGAAPPVALWVINPQDDRDRVLNAFENTIA